MHKPLRNLLRMMLVMCLSVPIGSGKLCAEGEAHHLEGLAGPKYRYCRLTLGENFAVPRCGFTLQLILQDGRKYAQTVGPSGHQKAYEIEAVQDVRAAAHDVEAFLGLRQRCSSEPSYCQHIPGDLLEDLERFVGLISQTAPIMSVAAAEVYHFQRDGGPLNGLEGGFLDVQKSFHLPIKLTFWQSEGGLFFLSEGRSEHGREVFEFVGINSQ